MCTNNIPFCWADEEPCMSVETSLKSQYSLVLDLLLYTIQWPKNLHRYLSLSFSQFVSWCTGSRGRCFPSHTVLGDGPNVDLLGSFLSVRSVPVCTDGLVVPDGGRLGVAEVTWLARVVRRVNQQRLNRERSQIPRLEVGHVGRAERKKEKKLWFQTD